MITGDIQTLDIEGGITPSILLDGNVNEVVIDSSISTNSIISGDISSGEVLDGNIESDIDIEATINPMVQINDDYNRLINKPKINYVELRDNKTLDDLNIQVKGDYPDEALTNLEIEELIDNFV